MNYYSFHLGDFYLATRHLQPLERHLYRDMLDIYYETEKPLTLDKRQLFRKLAATSNEWQQAVEDILAEYFTETAEGWRNERCDEEIAAHKERQEESQAKNEHEQERLKRFRADRRRMFADLRAKGIVPAWDIRMPDLRKLHETTCNVAVQGSDGDVNENATTIPLPIPHSPLPTTQELLKKEAAEPLPKKPTAPAAPLLDKDPADTVTPDIFEEYFGDAMNAPATPIPAETAPAPAPVAPKPPAAPKSGPSRRVHSFADIDLPAWLDRGVWRDWDAFRMGRPKGAKWEATTAKACLAELTRLYEEGSDPARVINKSIAGGHTGLFPVPGSRHQVAVKPTVDPDIGMPPHLSPLEQRNWRNMQIALAQDDPALRTITPEEFHA